MHRFAECAVAERVLDPGEGGADGEPDAVTPAGAQAAVQAAIQAAAAGGAAGIFDPDDPGDGGTDQL